MIHLFIGGPADGTRLDLQGEPNNFFFAGPGLSKIQYVKAHLVERDTNTGKLEHHTVYLADGVMPIKALIEGYNAR